MSLRRIALTFALRRWVKPRLAAITDIAVARAQTGRMRRKVTLPAGWTIRSEAGPDLKGEWIEPVAAGDAARERCIYYLHGGGYIMMSPVSHRPITTRLAVWSGSRLFALDYRLAPESPFPAALDDAVAGYRALVGSGIAPGRIVVAGDSAGGGLALALLVALRDAGEALPAAAVLFSAWTDLAATGESIAGNAESDAFLTGSMIGPVARLYLGEAVATDPRASPLYADLAGLPPLLFQVSDNEVLLDDSRRVFEKALASGVDATLLVWKGLPHVWQLFAGFLPEGRGALREAAEFIRGRFSLRDT